MAITLIASTTAAPGSTGGTTAAINTTGASLIVVGVGWYTGSGGTPTVTDSKGNTYAYLTAYTAGSGATRLRLFYTHNPTVGSGHTFTVSSGAFNTYPGIAVHAFSGVAGYQIERGATTTGNGPLACGSLTPSADGALVLTVRAANGNTTTDTVSPSGFAVTTKGGNSPGPNVQVSMGYYVQSIAAAINPTWAWSPSTATETAVTMAIFVPVALPLVATIHGPCGTAIGGTTNAVNTTGATLIVVALGWYAGGGGTPTVSDSKGNTYIGLTTRASGNTRQRLWYVINPIVGVGHSVTVTSGGVNIYPAIVVDAYAYAVGSYQVESGATGTTSPLASGSVSPSLDGALVVTGRAGNGSIVADAIAGFIQTTVPGNGVPSLAALVQASRGYVVQSVAAAINPTWSWVGTSGENAVSTVVFLPAEPDVDTLAADAIAPEQATLHGQIDPNTVASTGHFAWGLSPGALVNTTAPVSVGSGTAFVAISANLTGLAQGTTYYFQAVATAGGVDYLGAVLSFTTLVEQTFQDGGVSHPLTWITLTKKDGTKHPYSEVDLNDPEDYYDGYKRPRVERFLTIARGLSDRDGQIEHMSFGAILSDIATDRFDSDREFRGTLADAVNKYLTNRPLEVWFIDDVERRQLGLARLAAVGYVNDYAPTADLHFEVKGADWLKKKFSRKRRAQQSWQPLITAADFPACPEDTLNSPAPLIYGSLGLGGADAVLGVTVTVNAQPTAAPGSFALSLQAGGKTAGVTRYYKVSAIVGGIESEQAGPLVATTTDTNRTIRATWAAVPGATAYYLYSSHRSDFLQGAMLTVGSGVLLYNDTTVLPNENKEWITGTNWKLMERINLQYHVYANLGGGLFSLPGIGYSVIAPIPYGQIGSEALLHRSIAVAWTAHAGATGGYRIVRRRSYYSDWNAVFDRQWDVAAGVLTVTDDLVTTSAVSIPAGELIAVAAAGQAEAIFVGRGAYGTSPITVSALLVARHACARVGAIYIPQTTEGVDGETATTYARVPDDQYGVSWFAPGHPGWIYPEMYVEMNGQWFTLIFTTVEPLPDKVLVDVDGIETDADGTGTLIRSLIDQRLHFMVNFVAPDAPWASGPYLTAADTVFPHIPEIPLVDEESHTLVKAQLAARLASGDYEGAMIIGADREFVTALDALARFQQSGDFDQTFNRKGQDMVTCEPIEAGEDIPTIDDVLSIREGSFNLVDQVQSAFFNILPYVHSRDYTGRERTGWYGNAEIRSEDSITNYDQEREAPRVELHACRANTPQGSATIADVMARKLARYQDPRRIGSLQMPFEGLEYEPGSTAAITHIEGIGASGWSGREVRFIRHEVEPTTGIVRLDFYDLTAVLENHEALRRRRDASTTTTEPKGAIHEPQRRSETRTPDQRTRRAGTTRSPRPSRSPRPAR